MRLISLVLVLASCEPPPDPGGVVADTGFEVEPVDHDDAQRRFSGTLSVSTVAYATLVGDSANEEAGIGIVAIGDTNKDGYDDFVVASECDRTAVTSTGATGCWQVFRSVLGPVPSGRRTITSVAARRFDYRLSTSVLFATDLLKPSPDLTGDGLSDFTMRDRIFAGPFHSSTSWYAFDVGDYRLIRGGGDVTGDKLPDLIATSASQPKVYVFAGPIKAAVGPAAARATVTGPSNADFGWTLAPGHYYNNGHDGFAISAPRYNANSGALYIFHGPVVGNYVVDQAPVSFLGVTNEYPGTYLDAGDIKGNGQHELLITGTYTTIPIARTEYNDPRLLKTVHRRIWTQGCGTLKPARAIGDTDGDGNEDFLVQNANHNKIELYYGPANYFGSPDAVFTLPNTSSICTLDLELAGLGDIDNDGLADFAIGDPRGSGTVYVLLGRAL